MSRGDSIWAGCHLKSDFLVDIGLELGFKCLITGQTGKKEEGSNWGQRPAQEGIKERPADSFQEQLNEQFDLTREFVKAAVGN